MCTFFLLHFYIGISPDADIPHDLVISGSKDCSVKVWNMNQPCLSAVLTSHGHTACVNCVAARENIAASAADDCSVRVWDIVTVWLHFNFLFWKHSFESFKWKCILTSLSSVLSNI